MTATKSASVLERKLAAAREDGAQNSTGRGALRALRLALGRAAADLFDLPLSVIGATRSRVTQEGLVSGLHEDRLMILMEGSEGRKATALMDRGWVNALIRQQTMGQVSAAPPAERAFTGTDAALVAPLVEAVLRKAAGLTDNPDDQTCLDGYRFGARAEDLRGLLLALDADRFRVFCLTAEFAGGAVQGSLQLVLPEPQETSDTVGDRGMSADSGHGQPTMDQSFGAIRAEISVVLDRVPLSLSEFSDLRSGQTIPVRRQGLQKAELVGINGQILGAGRLGRTGGMRALRVNETPGVAPGAAEAPEVLSDPDEDFQAAEAHTGGLVPPAADAGIATDAHTAPDPPMLPETADMTAQGGARAGDEAGDLLNMTPKEAAAEISELAGLSLIEAEGVILTEDATVLPDDGAG